MCAINSYWLCIQSITTRFRAFCQFCVNTALDQRNKLVPTSWFGLMSLVIFFFIKSAKCGWKRYNDPSTATVTECCSNRRTTVATAKENKKNRLRFAFSFLLNTKFRKKRRDTSGSVFCFQCFIRNKPCLSMYYFVKTQKHTMIHLKTRCVMRKTHLKKNFQCGQALGVPLFCDVSKITLHAC